MKQKTTYTFLLFLFLLAVHTTDSYAQLTKITGTVTDSISKEALPFVNVQLIGTKEGATTDFNGRFAMETNAKGDSMLISYVGYHPKKIKINPKTFQNIDIRLSPANFELSEVVIIPGENPAHRILRKIIENKEHNNHQNFDSYEYQAYNKIQIDANNITEQFKNRRAMRPFQFVFENVDTSTINGKSYLPLLLTESISELYYRSKPETKKEVILASRASGINNSSVSQFLGNMHQDINIYDNYMVLFDKNFVSPIANFGLRTYRYYLVDSTTIEGHWCYKIMFKPRRKQEFTFTGELWIADTSFAIKEVDMKIEKANLNYVSAMSIKQEFAFINNQYWAVKRDNFVVDFNVVDNTKKVTGFYGHKTTLYQNIVINRVRPDEDYRSNVGVEVDQMAWNKPEEFWDTARFEELNQEEQKIYQMVDTVVNMPAFKNIYNIITMFATGYYNTKHFDLGPYYTAFSFNAVEGYRFRFGGRTSNQLYERLRFYGHVAYGTLDHEFKYGLGGLYIANPNPRRAFELSYKNDMEQLGESVRALKQDNILSSLLRVTPNATLTMVEQYMAAYEYEYFNGYSNTLTFRKREVFPLNESKFEIYENGRDQAPTIYNSIITSEIELKTHFAYKELFLVDKFNRTSFGSKYPAVDIWYAYGIPDFLHSQFSYHKLQIAIQQWFNVGTIGYSKYIVSWGKIWGKLPYPLLEVHPGNETFSYDDYAYNRMNYYEFISDRFFLANYSHNFQGLLFNHIPLIRKLKWREVIYCKVLIGSLTKENMTYSTFPGNTSFLKDPYYEVGVGIENIFKLIRADASWRLSYLNKPNIRSFGIMVGMHFDF